MLSCAEFPHAIEEFRKSIKAGTHFLSGKIGFVHHAHMKMARLSQNQCMNVHACVWHAQGGIQHWSMKIGAEKSGSLSMLYLYAKIESVVFCSVNRTRRDVKQEKTVEKSAL